MKLAAAAQAAIATEESHIWTRIREEELILDMLHDEAEHTSSRKKTALHQLESIYKGAKLYGVELPDMDELKHEALSEAPPETLQSPDVPLRTPPPQLFHELIVDVMNRSPESLSHEPSSLSSLSFMTSVRRPSLEHKSLSPPRDVLPVRPQLSPSASQALSEISPAGSSPTTPPPSIFPALVGDVDEENRKKGD